MAGQSDVFVGRQREMAELTSALDDALAGRGRLVMLVGEPGIGKTRTAEELAGIARERGADVLWGRCPEDAGAPPFWPWAQVIRSLVGARDLKALRAELGKGAAVIAEIVPEVRERLPGVETAPALEDPESSRFRLFDSFAAFLKRASENRPLMIVLDNLHWSDGSSLKLLEFVAPEISGSRILMLGTYRDVDIARGHPLFRSLGELTRQRLFQRAVLRGLGPGEVKGIITAAGAVSPPHDLVSQVHAHTEGNPFFVREVVTLLNQEGLLTAERMAELNSWDFRLPEGVREVIGRRLDRLSRECNAILSVASVIGREFDAALLGRLVASAQTDKTGAALEVLEEALAARIVESIPGSPGRYRFAHALIQQTLREEVPAVRQVRVHALIATALENMYGERSDEHAAELAAHFAEAEPTLGGQKVVRYSMLAGGQALAAFAYEEALLQFRRALAVLGSGPMDAERAALTAGAAAANAALRNIEASLTDFRTAFDYYVGTGDIARAAVIAQQKFVSGEGMVGMVPLQERALELLPRDAVSAGLILVRHSRALGLLQDDYERANGEINRALEIAQLHKDTYLELQAHAAGAIVSVSDLKPDAEVRHALRVVELTKAIDEPLEASFSYYVLAFGSAREGNAGQMRAYRDAAIAAAGRAQDRERLSSVHWAATVLAKSRGEWDEARRFSDISLGYWKDDDRTLGQRTIVEYQTGDYAAGDRMLARCRKITARHSSLALTEWQAEHITGTKRPGDRSIGAGLAEPRLFANAVARAFAVAERCCDALTREDATPESLSQLHDELVAVGPSFLQRLPIIGISDFPAFLARKLGDYDRAIAHYEESMRFKRKAGFRPYLAWTCADYAEMLLDRSSASSGQARPDNREKALKLQEEALQIARDLGMKPLLEKLAALKERLAARRGGRPEYPGGLTEREVEVLRLIAAGRSNAEIAERLVITPNTAAKHVANILLKINAPNRTAAATYASAHGLTKQ